MNTLKLLPILASILLTGSLFAADDKPAALEKTASLARTASVASTVAAEEAPLPLTIDRIPQRLTLEEFAKLCEASPLDLQPSTTLDKYPDLVFSFKGVDSHDLTVSSRYKKLKDTIDHFALETERSQVSLGIRQDARGFHKLYYIAVFKPESMPPPGSSICFEVFCRS